MINWREVLSRNLKMHRRVRDWSQDRLAEEANCSKSVIRDLESMSRGVSLDMLAQISNALGVDMETLLQSGQHIPQMSQESIDAIASGSTVYNLVDTLSARLKYIPEEVFSNARAFSPSDKVWKSVLVVMSDRYAEMQKDKNENSGT
jgi:transcriptional regulator with XRE-family HTH domain